MLFVPLLVAEVLAIAVAVYVLDVRPRRRRVEKLLPHLRKIIAATPATGPYPVRIAVWRRDNEEVVHIAAMADGVDYRLTRIGRLGKPFKFHVELSESPMPPIVDDLDWQSEAVNLLMEIFARHKPVFEQARAIRDGILKAEEARTDGLN
jgi:hypothetical protein